MRRETFGDTLKNFISDYDIQVIVGDFNARQTRWFTDHDRQRRGVRLLRLTEEQLEYTIHATPQPTFEAKRKSRAGTIRSSTVDSAISKAQVTHLSRVERYIERKSDHYPIMLEVEAQVDRGTRPRRIDKTFTEIKQVTNIDRPHIRNIPTRPRVCDSPGTGGSTVTSTGHKLYSVPSAKGVRRVGKDPQTRG